MPLHFVVETPGALAGDTVTLTGAEAHHAATVRRVRVGEDVTVGDGGGAWFSGTVSDVSPKAVTIAITERVTIPEPATRLFLAQALAKGDHDERAVQAATELGVDAIVPWQAARSVSRWDAAKQAKGVQRWQTIVREASKQAHRAWIPEVTLAHTTKQLIARTDIDAIVVLEPSATQSLTKLALPVSGNVLLVVGPEGGVSPEELAQFAAAGAHIVQLGNTVLRTSTAGPAALAVCSVALGRW